MAILADLQDPRIRDVTVTHVEVSGDMRHAKVHVSVMGDETRQRLSLRGLQSAAGFLQSKVAKRIDTRYTPRIEFLLDSGVKKSIEVARILHEVLPPPPVDPDADDEDDEAASEEPDGLGPTDQDEESSRDDAGGPPEEPPGASVPESEPRHPPS